MAKHLARMRNDIKQGRHVNDEVLMDIRAYCLLIAGMQAKEEDYAT